MTFLERNDTDITWCNAELQLIYNNDITTKTIQLI